MFAGRRIWRGFPTLFREAITAFRTKAFFLKTQHQDTNYAKNLHELNEIHNVWSRRPQRLDVIKA